MDLSPFLFGLYKFLKLLLYPFTWVVLLVTVVMVLAFLPISFARLRWIRLAAVSAFLVLFLLANPLVSRVLIAQLEQRAPRMETSRLTGTHFYAIVVLGGGALGKGSLRPTDQLQPWSMERTICGADLYRQGLAPRLLMAGGDASIYGQGPIEAVEMKDLAVHLGVPQDAILLDTISRTTYENAVQAKRILGAVPILLVTSASHVPRAMGLFRKQGLEATPYPCGYLARERSGSRWDVTPFDLIPQLDALQRSTTVIIELMGMMIYWALGKL
jgi:uncharacterized SAM-binding protein YcdF (DUF218 family)